MQVFCAESKELQEEGNLWVSAKLNSKLLDQLDDPLSVISGTLPLWVMTLPRLRPLLFSADARKKMLRYTAFGPAFAVHWAQEGKLGPYLHRRMMVQTELNSQTNPRKMQELSQELSNIEEHVVKSAFWLGTLQSTLLRVQKGEALLRQAEIAMELLSSSGQMVEVQFDGETGFGSAVTQSFYVEVSLALQERERNRQVPLWVEDDGSSGSQYLLCRKGLLMRPLPVGAQREEAVRRFRFLGRLMGQALREGFIVPLPVAEEVFALILGRSVDASSFPRPGSGMAGELCGVFADFAAHLKAEEAQQPKGTDRESWRRSVAERQDFRERFLAQEAEDSPSQKPTSFKDYVESLCACFVETGLSGTPLCAGGDDMPVSAERVEDFVKQATEFWFCSGVRDQVEAFRGGLNEVFPFESLLAFSPAELRNMFCGEDHIEWDEQALTSHLHPVGGLSQKSSVYTWLVAALLDMDQATRSRFLDFVSSCPRLPPGGIANFHLDVYPDPTGSKQGFPRSRACANQLYLPSYNSKEELTEKLHEAVHSSSGHHEQRMRDL
jgi:E3 ubiquitin-protein ligase TRIP12